MATRDEVKVESNSSCRRSCTGLILERVFNQRQFNNNRLTVSSSFAACPSFICDDHDLREISSKPDEA